MDVVGWDQPVCDSMDDVDDVKDEMISGAFTVVNGFLYAL